MSCGPGSGPGSPVTLTVLAASSLSRTFPAIGRAFEAGAPGVRVRFSFAGTDALVAQIEQGAPADVFAGAAVAHGERLAAAGLVGPVEPFCTNRIVLIVPGDNPAALRSPADLAREGVTIVVAAPSVPAGAYARETIAALGRRYGDGYEDRVLANVVSEELEVESVLTKVLLGEADAGFVYATDAAAADEVRTVPLPPGTAATATYPIAVVSASAHGPEARAFVAFVVGDDGQRILASAGFGPPPP